MFRSSVTLVQWIKSLQWSKAFHDVSWYDCIRDRRHSVDISVFWNGRCAIEQKCLANHLRYTKTSVTHSTPYRLTLAVWHYGCFRFIFSMIAFDFFHHDSISFIPFESSNVAVNNQNPRPLDFIISSSYWLVSQSHSTCHPILELQRHREWKKWRVSFNCTFWSTSPSPPVIPFVPVLMSYEKKSN